MHAFFTPPRSFRIVAVAAAATLLLAWLERHVISSALPWEWMLRGELLRVACPRALLISLWVPSIFAVSLTSLSAMGTSQRLLVALGRSTLLLLLALALSGLSRRVAVPTSSTLLLVDGSASIPETALARADQFAHDYVKRSRHADSFERLLFAETLQPVTGSYVAARKQLSRIQASDYGRALRLAPYFMRNGADRRIVLIGDGADTSDELHREAELLKKKGLPLHFLSTTDLPIADVSVQNIELSRGVEAGRPFLARVHLHSTVAVQAHVNLELDGNANPRDSKRTLSLSAGHHSLNFEVQVDSGGIHQLRASLTVDGPDAFPENNASSLTFDVHGKPKVCVIDSQPSSIESFARALRAQKFEVTVSPQTRYLEQVDELASCDALVLSNLAYSEIGDRLTQKLTHFVEQGGTLLVSGGPRSFGDGNWSGTPLERLLPVTVLVPKTETHHDLALVLAIDRSGSMTGLPLQLAKNACAAAIDTLEPSDLVEVLAFDAKATRYVAMQPARLRASIINDLARITSGGDTELFGALDMAYQDLVQVEARRKHVILLTDGQSPTSGLSEMVRSMVADKITLTTVGLGSSVDAELLKRLADLGGGRYHAAPTPEALPKIFVREASTLSSPPEPVTSFAVQVNRTEAFLSGLPLHQLPKLSGYHRTVAKTQLASVILKSELMEPVLARIQRGQGWVTVWTSDLHERWAHAWLGWSHMGQFFAQLLREQLSDPDNTELPIHVSKFAQGADIYFDATFEDGRFDNERSIRLTSFGPKPTDIREIPVFLIQPGRYQGHLDIDQLGDYRLAAEHRRFDSRGLPEVIGTSHAQFSYSYPYEYEKIRQNSATISKSEEGLSRGPITAANLATAPVLPEYRYESLQRPLLLLAILALLTDLALRRLPVPHRSERNTRR